MINTDCCRFAEYFQSSATRYVVHSPIHVSTDSPSRRDGYDFWNGAMTLVLTTALKLSVFSAHL